MSLNRFIDLVLESFEAVGQLAAAPPRCPRWAAVGTWPSGADRPVLAGLGNAADVAPRWLYTLR